MNPNTQTQTLSPPKRPTLAAGSVATLGPAGTDAHAEAARVGADAVVLCHTFSDAMQRCLKETQYALVPAGYVDVQDSEYSSWVDLHFRFLDQLRLVAVWESPTKPMCIAARRDGPPDVSQIETLALHPSTRTLVVDRVSNRVQLKFVNAKPLAVQEVVNGAADACLGSVDVVRSFSELRVLHTLRATMVWCLYQSRSKE